MVKILPSGEIVQDNDPRANTNRRNEGNARNSTRRQGFIMGDEHRDQEPNQATGDGLHGQPVAQEGEGGNTISTFVDGLNNRLITAGFPRFNVGPYPIEPIVAVGTILAGLLMGLPGLLFAALLFVVVKWSRSGNMANFISGAESDSQTQRPRRDGGGSRGGSRGGTRGGRRGGRTSRGGGNRLGRS